MNGDVQHAQETADAALGAARNASSQAGDALAQIANLRDALNQRIPVPELLASAIFDPLDPQGGAHDQHTYWMVATPGQVFLFTACPVPSNLPDGSNPDRLIGVSQEALVKGRNLTLGGEPGAFQEQHVHVTVRNLGDFPAAYVIYYAVINP